MTDFCSIDGRLTPLGEGLPGGIYLYQRLRTVDYRPLHTEAHLSRLRDGAGSLFGRPAELPAGRIADEIGALLRANGYPAGGATVTLRLYADGTYALTADGVSLYRTYALRSLRPAAAVVPCDGYRPEWPTSARRETARWAQQEAERSGARCALLCDRDGIVRRAGDAPLFAVRDDVIYAAPLDDVEWTLVAEAARRAGIRWVERPSAQRSFGCSTNSSPSTARGSARSPPAKARPICRSRPNASPRHWRRFPNGRERFRAAAGRLAGRTGRPAFPEK